MPSEARRRHSGSGASATSAKEEAKDPLSFSLGADPHRSLPEPTDSLGAYGEGVGVGKVPGGGSVGCGVGRGVVHSGVGGG